MKLDLYTQSGTKKGTTDASDKLFKADVNEELLRLHLNLEMTNARKPIAHVKQRGEVRGGGKKPWRQKGTGRARVGSSRNPVWRGGGIVFGPRNVRTFFKRMNRKSRRAALFSALSQQAAKGSIFALDKYEAKEPKTKDFAAFVAKLPVDRSVLVVLDEKNANLEKSASNLPNVKTVLVNYLSVHDLLKYEKVMFMEPALKKAEELFLSK